MNEKIIAPTEITFEDVERNSDISAPEPIIEKSQMVYLEIPGLIGLSSIQDNAHQELINHSDKPVLVENLQEIPKLLKYKHEYLEVARLLQNFRTQVKSVNSTAAPSSRKWVRMFIHYYVTALNQVSSSIEKWESKERELRMQRFNLGIEDCFSHDHMAEALENIFEGIKNVREAIYPILCRYSGFKGYPEVDNLYADTKKYVSSLETIMKELDGKATYHFSHYSFEVEIKKPKSWFRIR